MIVRSSTLAHVVGPLPREHGAWAMLVVPWAVGCALGGGITIHSVLVVVGALALFVAQHRLADWYRSHRSPTRRGERTTVTSLALLTALGLGALAPPLAALPLPVSSVLAGAAALATLASMLLLHAHRDHGLPGQALGALGLSLTAPAAYLASGGLHGRVALALWVVNASFFLWGVFYVNLQILVRSRHRALPHLAGRFACAAPTLGANLALALVVVLAVRSGGFSMLALAAFAAPVLQSLAGVATLHRPAALRHVGMTLLAHSLAFALLFSVLA